MLSKEECEVVVTKLYQNGYVDLTDCDIIAKLIKEHFELIEVLKEVGWSGLDLDNLKTIIKAGQYNAEKLNSLREPCANGECGRKGE